MDLNPHSQLYSYLPLLDNGPARRTPVVPRDPVPSDSD